MMGVCGEAAVRVLVAADNKFTCEAIAERTSTVCVRERVYRILWICTVDMYCVVNFCHMSLAREPGREKNNHTLR